MKQDVVISSLSKRAAVSGKQSGETPLQNALWRLERLEAQMQKLSELVRDHAEDVDRLVRIVAEDRNTIRRQLLRKHHERVRVRKHLRTANAKAVFDE